jgi:hypothetical protein
MLYSQQIAQNLIEVSVPKDKNGDPINPLDARFRSLELSSMSRVDPKSKEFATLSSYVTDSHGSTHYMNINIQHAFRVQRYVHDFIPRQIKGFFSFLIFLIWPTENRKPTHGPRLGMTKSKMGKGCCYGTVRDRRILLVFFVKACVSLHRKVHTFSFLLDDLPRF